MRATALFTLLTCLTLSVSCSTLQTGDINPEDLSIAIKGADASIERLTDADHPVLAEEFILNVDCVLTINNASERSLKVMTHFYTPFDGLYLDILDQDGNKLTTTSHILSGMPYSQSKRKVKLDTGITTVRLRCDTPVGSFPPVGDFPYVPADKLTQNIQLRYHGGFPGTPFEGLQSSPFSVKVVDKTAVVSNL